MNDDTIIEFPAPEKSSADNLTQVLRDGAQRLLAQAVEAEAASFLLQYSDLTTADGLQHVVPHGRQPERVTQTGLGPVPVKKPRLRDRGGAKGEEPIQATSKILPPYMRRSNAPDELIPALYLRGIPTGEMMDALAALLGPNAFFPFADGVVTAAEAGATALIRPGGSMRDEEVIAAAIDLGLAMVFTGMRHFRH